MCHVADVLTSGVVNADVVIALRGKVDVAAMGVSNDGRASLAVFADELLKGGGFGVLDHDTADFAVLVSDANHGGLANCTTTCAKLLVGVLVLLFAANVGFINLHLAIHVVVAVFQPSLADALRKEPCGFLGDTKFTRHLGAWDTLAGAGEHENGKEPLDQGEAAFGQNRASADAEMLPAVLAAVGHGLVVLALCHADRAAVTANRLITPTLCPEELARGLFIRELAEELKGGEGFRLRHGASSFCTMNNLTSHRQQVIFG